MTPNENDYIKFAYEELKKYRPSSSISMGFETYLSRDERFLLNKIRSIYLDKLDEISQLQNEPPEI